MFQTFFFFSFLTANNFTSCSQPCEAASVAEHHMHAVGKREAGHAQALTFDLSGCRC